VHELGLGISDHPNCSFKVWGREACGAFVDMKTFGKQMHTLCHLDFQPQVLTHVSVSFCYRMLVFLKVFLRCRLPCR
jgi:hypothetical protein